MDVDVGLTGARRDVLTAQALQSSQRQQHPARLGVLHAAPQQPEDGLAPGPDTSPLFSLT